MKKSKSIPDVTNLYKPVVKFRDGKVEVLGTKFDNHVLAVAYGKVWYKDYPVKERPVKFGFQIVEGSFYI
ncbi:MAG TPA: hypothetical protein VIJ14_00040 [Rhabdochlamydiaceae bacterium]